MLQPHDRPSRFASFVFRNTRDADSQEQTFVIGYDAGIDDSLSPARRRVLDSLKRGGPRTATALAADLELTTAAVRQHLDALDRAGLVEQRPQEAEGPGRPAAAWDTTGAADRLFADRHHSLVLELLDALEDALGADAVDTVLGARARIQQQAYEEAMAGDDTLAARIATLARMRSEEGYMAEVTEADDQSFHLIERHCPVCDAAAACRGICAAELDVFRSALGPEVTVVRVEHLLSGDRRCTYRIAPGAQDPTAG